jgi:hypothetical protein
MGKSGQVELSQLAAELQPREFVLAWRAMACDGQSVRPLHAQHIEQ